MTLAAMRYAVARLLTDPEFQRRFLADQPAHAADYGLTADEFAALATLDPRKLGITTEGYAGKRFERVESAFPRTLRALEALEPKVRSRYLATTQFPLTEAAERATFLGFVRTFPGTPDAQRFVADLVALETLLYDAPAPRLPSYRWRPDATRPRAMPRVPRLRLRGPLGAALDGPPPLAYPEQPSDVLVLRDGPRLVLDDLGSGGAALLAACDGARTVAELARAFGGPGAEGRLERWMRAGVVEDAAAGSGT